VEDFIIENAALGIEREVLTELTLETTEIAKAEVSRIYAEHRKRSEYDEVSKLAKGLATRSALRMLVQMVANNAEGILVGDQLQMLLSRHLASDFLGRLHKCEVSKAELRNNAVLQLMHRQVTYRAAFESMVGDLGEAIAEEENLVHEKEVATQISEEAQNW